MDIFATYATNEDLEVQGTWAEIGDAKFLIARSGNRAYAKLFTREYEKNKRALDRKDDAADALAEKMMVSVVAKTILLGWEGVKYQGQDLSYSYENAKMLLQHREFRREIMALADDFSLFKAVQAEEDEKN